MTSKGRGRPKPREPVTNEGADLADKAADRADSRADDPELAVARRRAREAIDGFVAQVRAYPLSPDVEPALEFRP